MSQIRLVALKFSVQYLKHSGIHAENNKCIKMPYFSGLFGDVRSSRLLVNITAMELRRVRIIG
jgi:hypothetical protein